MNTWQLQDAKNKLSEVVERALNDGPQLITRHGKPAVVVQSVKEYEQKARPGKEFIDFLLSGPKIPDSWYEDGDPFERVDRPLRDIDL